MVEHPGDYRWSSYRDNAYGEKNALITEHPLYKRIHLDGIGRRHGYRALFETALDPEDVHRIRLTADFAMPLGDSRFSEQIEAALGRSIGYAQRGRPKRASAGGP
jgi:putative transposase